MAPIGLWKHQSPTAGLNPNPNVLSGLQQNTNYSQENVRKLKFISYKNYLLQWSSKPAHLILLLYSWSKHLVIGTDHEISYFSSQDSLLNRIAKSHKTSLLLVVVVVSSAVAYRISAGVCSISFSNTYLDKTWNN